MGKPKAPKAPDPVATANAQTASNKETAITQAGLNAVNQVTPQGNLTYTSKPGANGVPQYTATQTLSPGQQAIYDSLTSAQGNLANVAKDTSGRLGGLLAQPFSLSNDATEARLMELGSKRLDPALDRRREQEAARLSNQGIKIGSTAYDRAMEGINQGENDAYNQLLLTGRGQAVQEALMERSQPLNEIIGVASGTQVQQPSYVSAPQTGVGGTDVAGINQGVYNGQLAQYGQDMGQWNSTAGGLFGLGSSALMAFSDKRLKTNIEDTGERVAGIPVKEYTMKGSGERDIGVIAQDVEKKFPHLVEMDPSGYRKVNYGGLMRLGAKRAA